VTRAVTLDDEGAVEPPACRAVAARRSATKLSPPTPRSIRCVDIPLTKVWRNRLGSSSSSFTFWMIPDRNLRPTFVTNDRHAFVAASRVRVARMIGSVLALATAIQRGGLHAHAASRFRRPRRHANSVRRFDPVRELVRERQRPRPCAVRRVRRRSSGRRARQRQPRERRSGKYQSGDRGPWEHGAWSHRPREHRPGRERAGHV